MYSIYSIKCPKTFKVMYIGASKVPHERFKKHLSETTNIKKYQWIKSIRKDGYYPLFEILESGLNYYGADEREKFYISKLNPEFNIEPGGWEPPKRKGIKYSDEQKRKSFEYSVLKKKVAQMTKQDEVIFIHEGVREACRNTGIDHRSISQVAAGSKIRKSAGGFKWKYI